MLLCVDRDFAEIFFKRSRNLPIRIFGRARRVEHHPWNVERPSVPIASNLSRTKTTRAPGAELSERHAVGHAAADVNNAALIGRSNHLLAQHRSEIARMEAIADLRPAAIESDIIERPVTQPRVAPIAEDPLIGSTKLTGAGQDSATIDPNRKIKTRAVLESEAFRSELGAAVKRHRRSGRIIFRNAINAEARRELLICDGAICAVKFFNFQAAQLRNRIDAARAEQNESRTVPLAVFQNVDRAKQVMFDVLTTAGSAIDTAEHTGICRRVDDPVCAG